jgi:Ca2+:H+ antiporter
MRGPYRFGYLLLLAVPAAFAVHGLGAGPLAQFVVAALGIIPLAAVMGRATESLSVRLGPHLGAFLSASFGNAAELILGIAALQRGLIPVVKASITGSIIGNALLVFGLSVLVGGLRNGRQSFDRSRVGLQSTLLVVAAIGLTIPSILAVSLSPGQEVSLSDEVAGVFLLTYLLNLLYAFASRERKEEDVVHVPTEPAEAPAWGPWLAAIILLAATACVVVLSEFLVGAIETARDRGYLEAWGMGEVFLGVVVVAIIGNAAENSTAVLMAYRNKIDLALHLAIGSSLQIALLVMPVLVFVSLLVSPRSPLDLHFTVLEVLAVGASVLVVHLVAVDGQTHWMEGVLLLAVYLILAIAFFHVPAAEHHRPGAQPRNNSAIGAASARGTGWLSGPGRRVARSMPRARYTEAATSAGVTGRSFGSAPVRSDEPMTCPPRTPAPANRTVQQPGQWSRPPRGLSCGVRPNSPVASTSVVSSRPRWCRSSSSAVYARSNIGQSVSR